MTAEDMSLIEQIDKRLKRLEELLLNDKRFETIVEPKEVSGQCGENSCIHKDDFNQQKEVWKPKKGDFVLARGVVTLYQGDETENTYKTHSLEDGVGVFEDKTDCEKPTKEQVEAHLIEIAKKEISSWG